jgi:hypothetical protein
MSVNKLTYLLHLRVFLSFLRIVRGFDYPGKYISQQTRIIGSLLYLLICQLKEVLVKTECFLRRYVTIVIKILVFRWNLMIPSSESLKQIPKWPS